MCLIIRKNIEHIISECTLLAGTDYTKIHNPTAGILHQELALKSKLISNKEPYVCTTPCSAKREISSVLGHHDYHR